MLREYHRDCGLIFKIEPDLYSIFIIYLFLKLLLKWISDVNERQKNTIFISFPLKKSQNASSWDVERGLRLDEVGNNEEKQIGTDDDYKKN